jgi:hypothetical protein
MVTLVTSARALVEISKVHATIDGTNRLNDSRIDISSVR